MKTPLIFTIFRVQTHLPTERHMQKEPKNLHMRVMDHILHWMQIFVAEAWFFLGLKGTEEEIKQAYKDVNTNAGDQIDMDDLETQRHL